MAPLCEETMGADEAIGAGLPRAWRLARKSAGLDGVYLDCIVDATFFGRLEVGAMSLAATAGLFLLIIMPNAFLATAGGGNSMDEES